MTRGTEADRRRAALELAVVVAGAALLTTAMTFPFVAQMAHVGRIDNSDGQFSIWNVAWVARALVRDPRHVFDANIFYPHRGTLAYSESNLGAGLLAVPAYWLTRNPYFAHNVVAVLTFVLSFSGAYYLVRHLAGDRRAAVVSAICFAFCPYTFAHTSHIQLMMTAVLPFGMLAFHRLAERPAAPRAVALGATMAAGAACCGYYGVFVTLMVGMATLMTAAWRRECRSARYWTSIAIAACAAGVFVTPAFMPYFALEQATGFGRSLQEAVRYSANWPAYLASGNLGHTWMLPWIGHFNEVLFPGFIASGLGLSGIRLGLQGGPRTRETTILYTAMGGVALWASFGPQAGLYSVLYRAVPLFAWLPAPARFGIVVALSLSVLAGLATARLLQHASRATLLAAVLTIGAAAELAFPLRFRQVPPVAPAYQMLSGLSPAPVIEFPYFWRSSELHGHAVYMLNSTTHWMPLVNGYSDYFPPDFRDSVETMKDFPSTESFKLLQQSRPRYAVFHMKVFGDEDRRGAAARLAAFGQYLRPVYVDGETDLYEIVGYPQ